MSRAAAVWMATAALAGALTFSSGVAAHDKAQQAAPQSSAPQPSK